MYIEENIEAVKESIITSAPNIENGANLEDTVLVDLSSETSFILYKNNSIAEAIGPDYLSEEDILGFVISIYDSDESIKDEKLTYFIEVVEDIHTINYIYEFEVGEYLIISTRIQSLTNVDKVLNNINLYQSVFMLIAITLISVFISSNISRPLRKLNKHAKTVSNLNFNTDFKLKRKEKTYGELNSLNDKLKHDIDFDKLQEEKKKHLIMTINHEIKTPLAVMKGMIEGMIDGVGRYKDKDKYLVELMTQIETIENITKDLTYSLKLEDKAKKGDTTNSSIIIDALTSLEEFASKRTVKLNKNITESVLLINDELLIILVQNIVKNAILYTTNYQVLLTTEVFQGEYNIIVKNKGMIKKTDLDKIFESFYRADSLDLNESGSGLGLFIVKQICDIYGYNYKIFNDNGFVTTKVKIKISK
jgi:two-component system sensor histidine kinase VanS